MKDRDKNKEQLIEELEFLRHRVEETIKRLVEVASGRFGTEFFESMALRLSKAVGADYTLIGELQEGEKESIRTLSVVADGELADNFEYELADTPCENVVGKNVCSYSSGVAGQFPKDVLLDRMGVEGYVGVPLFDSQHSALGIMAVLFRKPLTETEFAESVLQIFSSWTGSEIERKRAEAAATGSEAKNRALLEAIPDLMFQLTRQGLHVDFHASNREQLFVPIDNVIGRRVDELLPTDVARKYLYYISQCLDGNRMEVFEYQLDFSETDRRDYEARMVPHEDGNVLAIIRDISQRRRSEEALVASEARYRAIVEDQTELICRNLPDATITFVNEAYCRCFHRSRNELVGKKFTPLIPEEDLPEVRRFFASLGPETPVATHEHRVIMPDGEVRWHQWTNRAILDDAGQVIEFQGTGRDVTERKEAQESWRIANSYLQLLKSVAVAANEAATVEEAFQSVLDEVCARMDWEGGAAVVAAGDFSRTLECPHIFNREFPPRWEPLREAWESDSFKVEETLPGRVFREKRPIMITDEQLRANPTEYLFGQLALDLGLKSALGFPVRVGKEVRAVLCFASSASKQLDDQCLGVMTDVGVQVGRVIERKLAEEALRESENRAQEQLAELNHVYQTAPVGLCLVDTELRFVRIN